MKHDLSTKQDLAIPVFSSWEIFVIQFRILVNPTTIASG